LGAIFVSYRRSDSQGEAGRLFDDLVKHFGERMVFMDVVGIEAGRDFRRAIEESVAQCGALLVVMGPTWLNAKDENGARRLDDPADFVRIETASALRRDIPVIPVLVRAAEMPRAEQLPETIRDLAYRNCIELTHARWRSDIQLLVEALRRLVVDSNQVGTGSGAHQSPSPAGPSDASAASKATSELESRSSVQIDPETVQRVSRELALHIGPIADIVVKRAASRCTSTEDLYLKVSEEIESQQERENFLRRQNLISSPRLSDDKHAVASLGNLTATSLPVPPPANQPRSTPVSSAIKTDKSSSPNYLLVIGGAAVVLILAVVLVPRFAARKGTNSPEKEQTSPQSVAPAESAPTASSERPPSASGVSGAAPASATESAEGNSVDATTPVATNVADQPRVRISRDESAALLISKVLPVYPSTAQQARIQGTVVLQAAISKDGTVESLREISGHPFLIPAAIDAVKQWRYKPYMLNGTPRAVETEISVNFVLKNQ
jgi:TonB family protein